MEITKQLVEAFFAFMDPECGEPLTFSIPVANEIKALALECLSRRAANAGAVVVEYDPAGEAMMGATLSHHAPIPESIRTILKAMGEGPCTVTIRREVKP